MCVRQDSMVKVDAASSTCPENPAQFCRRIPKPNRSYHHLSPETYRLTRWLTLEKTSQDIQRLIQAHRAERPGYQRPASILLLQQKERIGVSSSQEAVPLSRVLFVPQSNDVRSATSARTFRSVMILKCRQSILAICCNCSALCGGPN